MTTWQRLLESPELAQVLRPTPRASPSTRAGRGPAPGCPVRRSSVMRWQQQRSGLPFRADEVRRVALSGLLDAYRTAKRRKERANA